MLRYTETTGAVPSSKSAMHQPSSDFGAPSEAEQVDLKRRIALLEQHMRGLGINLPENSDIGGGGGRLGEASEMGGASMISGGIESEVDALRRELEELNARLAAQEREDRRDLVANERAHEFEFVIALLAQSDVGISVETGND